MKPVEISRGVYWAGAPHWDRRLFDAIMPLPDGTSYNAYIVKGDEKTALLDTVDPSQAGPFLSCLEGMGGIDYIISHHAEQDHSGLIPEVLERYPDAVVVATPKGRSLLLDHLPLKEEKIITVADGETISLGAKTLEFLHTPWVHWPETMCTYLREERILFSCDLFGSHLATSGPFSEERHRVSEAAKRYYAEVMMPFRALIRKHLERLEGYTIEMIAPSHGPVHRDARFIMDIHRGWVSDVTGDTVVIAYATMHGSTEILVEHLTDALAGLDMDVRRFNLAVTDIGKFIVSLVDAATIVFGSPTILSGAHPLVIEAAFITNSLRPKLRFASIIGSYGWAGKTVEQIRSVIAGLKLEELEPVMVKGRPAAEDLDRIKRLAQEIKERHGKEGMVSRSVEGE